MDLLTTFLQPFTANNCWLRPIAYKVSAMNQNETIFLRSILPKEVLKASLLKHDPEYYY